MSTNQNGTALTGGNQAPLPKLRVRLNPEVSQEDRTWVVKALQAIGADNAPALRKLLAEKKRPLFGQNCTFQEDGQSDSDSMTFLQFALIAQSDACVEILSQHWHAANLYEEVDEAILPFMEAYEFKPECRTSPRFHLPMAALARGLFKSQAANKDYGLSSANCEFPLASRAIARIDADLTPKPTHGSKLYMKRAYWLRRAAASIADDDAAELTACLGQLAVLPNTLPEDDQYLEANLLLLACVLMRRISCSAPLFKSLTQTANVQGIHSFIGHFLMQLSAQLNHCSSELSSSEEDELAAGVALVMLSLNQGSPSTEIHLSVLASKDFIAMLGKAGAVASKAVLQVECHSERDELAAISIPKSSASASRISSSI